MKKEALQKKADILDRKIKFFQNMLLAILSGITAVVFGISQEKVNLYGIFFVIIGLVIAFIIMLYIKKIEDKEDLIIEKIEKEN